MGRCLILLAMLLTLAGCGSSGLYWVEGNVTWEGAPVEKGNLILKSLDPAVSDDAGEIINGKYKFEAKPGKKSVRIHASREAAEIDPVMGAKPQIPYIPPAYSGEESKLQMEVTPQGPNKFDFNLPVP